MNHPEQKAISTPVVGKTIPHDSAFGHVTGTAPYIDDLPRREDELYVGFVGSPIACGTLDSVDTSAAKDLEGVVAIFTQSDVGSHNIFGPIISDEPFLAENELLYVGQPVVVIAAENTAALELAKKRIKLEVTRSKPVFKIRDAIQQSELIGPRRQIRRGDPEAALAEATHRLSGEFETDGQEQFYLESQAAAAYPGEQGQLVIHSSTQNTTEIQVMVAEVLGLSQHQVVCICKRMGGAFGGKETQAAIPH